ncbi:uncharacterized protein HMPREF1541_06827 [Cyphellophora europaea CBS 101466]|uniref:Uncharacterized protein n=1 Tax=Cyphellophora europaea (strain CBS 101466) TaxID=1220924 RepID=W2RST9_CYPE1|nr:uncharacterized protein HMPREF1541_06827 [Cyphellophora europaea CBS 101466]ETN38789.1 hypothetical protein HMPREF1541_06827 [Cyphellophora europaea CBS 101466]
MGFWNDGIRSPSPSRRSSSSKKTYYASRPAYSRSASSFFSSFSGAGGGSRGYYSSSRARPRHGFMNRIKKFLRDIYSYMRRHPIKVFMLVVMPLLTSGALVKILAQFGVRLPRGLESMVGGAQRGGEERFYARGGARDYEGGSALPGMFSGENLGSLLGIARAFI